MKLMKHIGTSVLDNGSSMEQAIAPEVIPSEGRVHHSIAFAQAILLKANMFGNLINMSDDVFFAQFGLLN